MVLEEEGIESGLAEAVAITDVGWAWYCCLAGAYEGGGDGGRLWVFP